MLARVTRLFPLWAVLVSLAAYFSPASFSPIAPHVTTLLTIIMLAMGVTLSLADFKRVFTRPAPVVAGIVLHYLVMPLAAWAIAKVLRMPPDLTAGMVLVGSVASGTASNVMIYLARGDVALSVTISALSTLVGVFATPLLTRLYVDASIAVDVHGMLMSILQIVALPIVVGLVINHLFGKLVRKVEPILPLVSMVAILLIIAAVVGGTQKSIASVGLVVMLGRGAAQRHWPARRLLGRPSARLRRSRLPHAGHRSRHAELRTRGHARQAVFLAARGTAGRAVLGVAQPVGFAARGVLGGPPRQRLHASG